MKRKSLKGLFRGVFVLIFTLMSVSAMGQIKAEALADGTYTVPVKSINKDTGGTSASQAYLGSVGDVTVNNGTYTVSVPISATGQSVLKSATVGGSSILSGSNLTFTLSGETSQVEVAYHIVVTMPGSPKPLIDMSPSAYERFDWANAQPTGTGGQQESGSSPIVTDDAGSKGSQNNESETSQISTTPKKDADGNAIGTTVTVAAKDQSPVSFDVINNATLEFKQHANGSGYGIYVNGIQVGSINNGPTPTVKPIKDSEGNVTGYQISFNGSDVKTITNGAPGATGAQGPASPQGPAGAKGEKGDPGSSLADVSKLSYTVLKSTEKSVSEANKYYTHVAKIEKLSDGTYKVTMYVQYGKKSGMSAKGFVPLTVNGQKVSDVTYGSTDKDYTASFSFTVKSLDDLIKAPVKGTIHVSVAMLGISSDFDVYYQFASSSQNSNGSGAAEAPGSAKVRAAKKSSSKLPQTNEVQDIAVAAVGLISLMLIVATVIYRRKQA